jgi:hypothetical protein
VIAEVANTMEINILIKRENVLETGKVKGEIPYHLTVGQTILSCLYLSSRSEE